MVGGVHSVSHAMTPSPMLQAAALLRVNVDAMPPEDLQAHAQQVLDTIAALNDWLASPAPRSAPARVSAMRQWRKLCLHMAHVRDLVAAHQAAMAMLATAQAAGSAHLAPTGKPVGL